MSEFLRGKTAVVTGASRGLGKAMATALAREGVQVALVARGVEKLNAAAEEIRAAGGTAEAFPADVTDEAQVVALERAVHERLGAAQILINNAGMNLRKMLVDFTLEEWRRVMDANLTSVFLMCRAFVPGMKGTGYGRILNMASIMSHISMPERTLYSSSKAAVLGLTRALALELAEEGINVIAISPGPFETEINASIWQDPEKNAAFLARVPMKRWGRVPDIGALAVFLCSEAASFMTGSDLLIDGGWTAQ
jgi:NAD(P)-dependent dehydrogenase (short-subunit alcohol dehydrogenase family)